jgi:toxin FitB
MRLIDTNLIIYSAQPHFHWLLPTIKTNDSVIATITRIEVLGFKGIQPREEEFFKRYFSSVLQLSLSENIISKAIELRQKKKIKLGDSIIAATAIIHEAELYTHNVTDFNWIEGLVVIDPIS